MKSRKKWVDSNPEKYEEAKRLRLDGEPVNRIASQMGTTFATLMKAFRKDGIVFKAWGHKKIEVIEAGSGCPCLYGIPCSVHTKEA